MKQNTRKGLALLLAGALVVTSLGYTTSNVLKAANPDNAQQTQEISNIDADTPETAVSENPEVRQEEIDLDSIKKDNNMYNKPGQDKHNVADLDKDEDGPVVDSGVAQWTAKDDTAYTVKYFGYDGNGGWTVIKTESLEGTTDETAEAEIKEFEGYTYYEAYADNKLSGKIAGNGSLVLEVYYSVNATVNITGNCDTLKYDGTTQNVTGYELAATTEVKDVTYDVSKAAEITGDLNNASLVAETAAISKIASGKDVGTYEMGLAADQFRNTDPGFNVCFNLVSDGQLEIIPRHVVLTSADATKQYDGKPLIKDEITISGDGFVEGEGFGYYFTGYQTKVGESLNVFKCMITEEYQNTKKENYDVELVYGTLTVTAASGPATEEDNVVPPRRVINVIADGDGYILTEIAGGEVPLGKLFDANCCILHLLLMLGAFGVLCGYTRSMKKRQERIFELEDALARAGML